MKFYDLSHTIENDMPVYPGTEQPKLTKIATVKQDGYSETSLNIESHTGTHLDAPAHMLAEGLPLGEMPVSEFAGTAFIIQIPGITPVIEKSFLQPFTEKISSADFILLKTGWSNRWGTDEYFEGFPVLSAEACEWLCSFNLKGIGIDAISFDPVGDTKWINHYRLFEKGLFLIENLNYPQGLDARSGIFYCFPLKFPNADGSPVRAVFAAD